MSRATTKAKPEVLPKADPMVKKRAASKTRKKAGVRAKAAPSIWMTPSEKHKVYLAVALLLLTICSVAVASGEVYQSPDGSWHCRIRDRSGHTMMSLPPGPSAG